MSEPRYVVTELEGYPIKSGFTRPWKHPGLSVHVIDRRWNHRLVATYRTDDMRSHTLSREDRRDAVRQLAATHAERLNREHERAYPADAVLSDLTPACPRCGDLCAAGVERCASCGAKLYPPGVSTL